MLLNQYLNYLKYERRNSKHTIIAYKKDLEQFYHYLATRYNIEDWKLVESTFIRSWIIELMQEGISNTSINRKLAALRAFYKFLIQKEIITINPTNNVIPPKKGKKLPEFIPAKEMNLLLNRTDFGEDYEGVRNYTILELFYQTGIRRSELLNLKVSDIDFQQKQIKIFGKGNKERRIPFGNTLEEVLKNYLIIKEQSFEEENNHLFLTSKGNPMYPKLVYNVVRKYLGIITTLEQKSPHIIRHSFATHLLNNGAEIEAIKKLLGHENLAATQIYTHNTLEKLKQNYQNAHPRAKKD